MITRSVDGAKNVKRGIRGRWCVCGGETKENGSVWEGRDL